MKTLATLLLFVPLAFQAVASPESKEQPVQHMKLAEVTSASEAKRIFLETTAQIKSKTKLNPSELQEIHFITYSLEKSVAYFAESLTGEKQKMAQHIAEVVEFIHINSENNRKSETKVQLDKYFKLAAQFSADF